MAAVWLYSDWIFAGNYRLGRQFWTLKPNGSQILDSERVWTTSSWLFAQALPSNFELSCHIASSGNLEPSLCSLSMLPMPCAWLLCVLWCTRLIHHRSPYPPSCDFKLINQSQCKYFDFILCKNMTWYLHKLNLYILANGIFDVFPISQLNIINSFRI